MRRSLSLKLVMNGTYDDVFEPKKSHIDYKYITCQTCYTYPLSVQSSCSNILFLFYFSLHRLYLAVENSYSEIVKCKFFFGDIVLCVTRVAKVGDRPLFIIIISLINIRGEYRNFTMKISWKCP